MEELPIVGAWLITSPVWPDNRGNFREWFKSSKFFEITGKVFEVNQANISISKKGTVRGIHYSMVPKGQHKWVTCVMGSIVDVVVDLRHTSLTYGKSVSIELKAGDGRAVFIEHGLGHGFVALEDQTAVTYLVSSEYQPNFEYSINPMDADLAINWKSNLDPDTDLIISGTDSSAPSMRERKETDKLPL